jgi:hypothetical protein
VVRPPFSARFRAHACLRSFALVPLPRAAIACAFSHAHRCRAHASSATAHDGADAALAARSAIRLPESSFPLFDALPARLIEDGLLSKLQLEGILYACTVRRFLRRVRVRTRLSRVASCVSSAAQKHQEFLPDNRTRSGFFIGDGAGVGKGRQVSGIILDSFARGRKQHLWISTSGDLVKDAERDLRDLGVHLNVINGPQALDSATKAAGLSREFKEAVLFCTYASLTSSPKKVRVMTWQHGMTWHAC